MESICKQTGPSEHRVSGRAQGRHQPGQRPISDSDPGCSGDQYGRPHILIVKRDGVRSDRGTHPLPCWLPPERPWKTDGSPKTADEQSTHVSCLTLRLRPCSMHRSELFCLSFISGLDPVCLLARRCSFHEERLPRFRASPRLMPRLVVERLRECLPAISTTLAWLRSLVTTRSCSLAFACPRCIDDRVPVDDPDYTAPAVAVPEEPLRRAIIRVQVKVRHAHPPLRFPSTATMLATAATLRLALWILHLMLDRYRKQRS
jgi:hypothetical protein